MNPQDHSQITAGEVRKRIEVLHGNVVAQRASNEPPTSKEATIQAAYLAGRLHGLSSALQTFRTDVTRQEDSDVNDAYRALSEEFQHVTDVATVEETHERGGFE